MSKIQNTHDQLLTTNYYYNTKIDFGILSEHFEIVKEISKGGFGSVYLAKPKFEQSHQHNYAIKMIIGTIPLESIEIEILFSELLSPYPEFPDFVNFIHHKSRYFLVYRMYEFTEFNEFVDRCELSDIVSYQRNLLLALAKLHSLGIVHQDIKPSNFLYDFYEKKGV